MGRPSNEVKGKPAFDKRKYDTQWMQESRKKAKVAANPPKQSLHVSKTCNLNYAKKYCPALQPPKSTPRYSHLKAPAAVKHMVAHVVGLLDVSEQEEKMHGENVRKHKKLVKNG